MRGYGGDAHKQDAFSSRVAHRRSAAGPQVIMSIVYRRWSVSMRGGARFRWTSPTLAGRMMKGGRWSEASEPSRDHRSISILYLGPDLKSSNAGPSHQSRRYPYASSYLFGTRDSCRVRVSIAMGLEPRQITHTTFSGSTHPGFEGAMHSEELRRRNLTVLSPRGPPRRFFNRYY